MPPKESPTKGGRPRKFTRTDSLQFKPPDGGYGWVIVFASFVLQTISLGTVFSVGVYLPEWLDTFGHSRGETAWIGSINTGVFALMSPLSSILSNKFSYRTVTMLGGFLACLGVFTSAFATSIYQMYFTYGVIAGFGICFSYIPSVVIIGYYFRKRRVIALGLSASGVGFGNLILPPILRALIKYYGWRGCMMVSGGICLNICVFGALLLPVEVFTKGQTGQKMTVGHIFNLSLFKECKFWVFFFNNVTWNFAIILLALGPDYARSVGISRDMGALLVSIVGLTGCAARLTSGIAGSHPRCNRRIIYTVCTWVRGFSMVIYPAYPSFAFFAFCSAMYGLAFGAQLGVYAAVTAELFGMTRFVSAYGYAFCGVGVGGLVAPPIGGWLYKVRNSYDVSFYFGGTVTMFSAVLMCTIPLIEYFEGKREQEPSQKDIEAQKRKEMRPLASPQKQAITQSPDGEDHEMESPVETDNIEEAKDTANATTA